MAGTCPGISITQGTAYHMLSVLVASYAPLELSHVCDTREDFVQPEPAKQAVRGWRAGVCAVRGVLWPVSSGGLHTTG